MKLALIMPVAFFGLVFAVVSPARADLIAACAPGTTVHSSTQASTQFSSMFTIPADGFAGSASCTATAEYGLLRASSQLQVATFNFGFSGISVSADGIFTDQINYQFAGSGIAFLRFRAVADGIISGQPSSRGQLAALGQFDLEIDQPGGGPVLAACAAAVSDNGHGTASCDAIVPIQLGLPGSFLLKGDLSAEVLAFIAGNLTADFSDTAKISSIEELDSNMNSLGAVTLRGSSGTIYGGAAAVPEPRIPALMSIGLALICLCARRYGTAFKSDDPVQRTITLSESEGAPWRTTRTET